MLPLPLTDVFAAVPGPRRETADKLHRLTDILTIAERIKASIERVLQQDSMANVGVQSVAEVVTRMRAIDTRNCPNDFRSAYLAHIHAWELMMDVERAAIAFKAEANSDGVLVESFICGLLGDPLGKTYEIQAAQTQLQHSYQSASLQVKQTFHRVEELAVLDGANLSK